MFFLLKQLDFKYCILFQILDLGVILHPGSYLREFWNIMDAVVVVCAGVSMAYDS